MHLKKSDPVLRAIIERVGPCRMEFGPPEFSSLAEAIVYQQLNGKAALTIFKRFAALAGDPLTPEGILKLTDAQMRGVGLSKQKSAYLKDLAAKTHGGLLDFARLADAADEEVIEHLTQVKGIGVWTAHMFLIFSLRRPNVQAEGHGEDRQMLGAVPLHRVLVLVAEPGYQDGLKPNQEKACDGGGTRKLSGSACSVVK